MVLRVRTRVVRSSHRFFPVVHASFLLFVRRTAQRGVRLDVRSGLASQFAQSVTLSLPTDSDRAVLWESIFRLALSLARRPHVWVVARGHSSAVAVVDRAGHGFTRSTRQSDSAGAVVPSPSCDVEWHSRLLGCKKQLLLYWQRETWWLACPARALLLPAGLLLL
jgi:hypothetical protein